MNEQKKKISLIKSLNIIFYYKKINITIIIKKQKHKNICFNKMSHIQPMKKIIQDIKGQKCTRKDCLSNNRGNLELVWFGKQYENKQITCTSCYMLDDQAIKKSIPATYNVVPLLKFSDKLLEEYKVYEQKKKTAAWHPGVIKDKKSQILNQLNNFQSRLMVSLQNLQTALLNFSKKLTIRNKQIYTHQTMNEIIEIKGKNSFQSLLDKINQLVKMMNYSELTKNYQFERIQIRNKKLQKEKEKIAEVSQKVDKVLANLIEDIRKRHQTISKI